MSIEVGFLIGITGTIFGIGIGYLNWRRVSNEDIKQTAMHDGKLQSDISYIKRGIDDIRVDMKVQEKRHNELVERVVKVEQEVIAAHKRIDCIG